MFRASLASHDARTADGRYTVTDNRYPNLKRTLTGSGSLTVPVDGANHTVTVAHNLGYRPIFQAAAKDRNGNYFDTYYFPMPTWDFVIGTEISWALNCDATNIYLIFFYDDYGAGDPDVIIDYTYRIFIDKAD